MIYKECVPRYESGINNLSLLTLYYLMRVCMTHCIATYSVQLLYHLLSLLSPAGRMFVQTRQRS